MSRFYQLLEPVTLEVKIKASRFIAELHPVKTPEDARDVLEQVRKREYTANHHCFAWRLGVGDEEQWKVSDDGEPAGTAGMPMYQVLKGSETTNLIAVVTRYFGGTKLGKGGLIRAYGGAVQDALTQARRKEFIPRVRMQVMCGFDQANLVYRLIEQKQAQLLDQDYGDGVTITFLVKKDLADPFAWELHELSNGQIKAKVIQKQD